METLTHAVSIPGRAGVEKIILIIFHLHRRNWFIWNHDTNKFWDVDINMYRDHHQGAFARIPEDAEILRECKVQNI